MIIWLQIFSVTALNKTISLFHNAEDYEVSWAMKMEFVEGVVLAMNYLHTRSSEIVHKDLKSSNVLVGRDMRVKVIFA